MARRANQIDKGSCKGDRFKSEDHLRFGRLFRYISKANGKVSFKKNQSLIESVVGAGVSKKVLKDLIERHPFIEDSWSGDYLDEEVWDKLVRYGYVLGIPPFPFIMFFAILGMNLIALYLLIIPFIGILIWISLLIPGNVFFIMVAKDPIETRTLEREFVASPTGTRKKTGSCTGVGFSESTSQSRSKTIPDHVTIRSGRDIKTQHSSTRPVRKRKPKVRFVQVGEKFTVYPKPKRVSIHTRVLEECFDYMMQEYPNEGACCILGYFNEDTDSYIGYDCGEVVQDPRGAGVEIRLAQTLDLWKTRLKRGERLIGFCHTHPFGSDHTHESGIDENMAERFGHDYAYIVFTDTGYFRIYCTDIEVIIEGEGWRKDPADSQGYFLDGLELPSKRHWKNW